MTVISNMFSRTWILLTCDSWPKNKKGPKERRQTEMTTTPSVINRDSRNEEKSVRPWRSKQWTRNKYTPNAGETYRNMCLRFKRTENHSAPSTWRPSDIRSMDSRRTPNKKPLYWKWILSTMSRPTLANERIVNTICLKINTSYCTN